MYDIPTNVLVCSHKEDIVLYAAHAYAKLSLHPYVSRGYVGSKYLYENWEVLYLMNFLLLLM